MGLTHPGRRGGPAARRHRDPQGRAATCPSPQRRGRPGAAAGRARSAAQLRESSSSRRTRRTHHHRRGATARRCRPSTRRGVLAALGLRRSCETPVLTAACDARSWSTTCPRSASRGVACLSTNGNGRSSPPSKPGRAAFPDTPTAAGLFPRPQKNPAGRQPRSTAQLAGRAGLGRRPANPGPSRVDAGRPVPFGRSGVPLRVPPHLRATPRRSRVHPDILKDLMGHEAITTTMGYYRVTAKRKREAQDRLGPLQLDGTGRAVRQGRLSLAASEAARDNVGQVAVPFGVCTEPAKCPLTGRPARFVTAAWAASTSAPTRRSSRNCAPISPACSPTGNGCVPPPPSSPSGLGRDALPSEEEIEALRRLSPPTRR